MNNVPTGQLHKYRDRSEKTRAEIKLLVVGKVILQIEE